jgi:hypothetical protein
MTPTVEILAVQMILASAEQAAAHVLQYQLDAPRRAKLEALVASIAAARVVAVAALEDGETE